MLIDTTAHNTSARLDCMAERDGGGISVRLYWLDTALRDDWAEYEITVEDHRTGDFYALTAYDGKEAMDKFRHPFCYIEKSGEDDV